MPRKERITRKKIDYKKMASSGLSSGDELKETEQKAGTALTLIDPKGASSPVKSSASKDDSTPVKNVATESGSEERKQLLEHLSNLDKKEERLREQKELEILRRQVEEREAHIRDLEKSVSDASAKRGSKPDSKSKKGKSRIASNQSPNDSFNL